MEELFWMFSGTSRIAVVKESTAVPKSCATLGREGVAEQCRCNLHKECSQPHSLSQRQDGAPLPNRREEARLEVTHSCRCSGPSARNCCYSHSVGKRSPKTGAQLTLHPQKQLPCMGPNSISGLIPIFNAPSSSQTV